MPPRRRSSLRRPSRPTRRPPPRPPRRPSTPRRTSSRGSKPGSGAAQFGRSSLPERRFRLGTPSKSPFEQAVETARQLKSRGLKSKSVVPKGSSGRFLSPGDLIRGKVASGQITFGQNPDLAPKDQSLIPQTVAFGTGGGGAGAGEDIKPITDIKWQEGNFTTPGGRAPDWWKPLIPSGKDMERPDVAYVAMLNAMIPYLSPEDQRRAAGQVYATVGGAHFGDYKGVAEGDKVPVSKFVAGLSQREGLEVIDKEYFSSSARSQGAITTLSELREQTVGGNREKIGGTGAGYRYLQNVLEQGVSFGSGSAGGQTRAQYMALQGALDPLMAQAGSIGPEGAIAQMLAQPFFSRGIPRVSQQAGRARFGQPNPLLFS